jgi:hypothetical protein
MLCGVFELTASRKDLVSGAIDLAMAVAQLLYGAKVDIMRYLLHPIAIAILVLSLVGILLPGPAFFLAISLAGANAMLSRDQYGSTAYWWNAVFFMVIVVASGLILAVS